MASMFAPRPPVEKPRTGTIDVTSSYDRKMVYWRDALLRQGESELRDCAAFQEAQRVIDYLAGNWWNPNRPGYRSRFFDNHLADVRRETIASLTDIRPNLDISSKVEAYKDQDTALSHYCRHLWDDEDLDLEVAAWIDHALFGTGFLKQSAQEPGDFSFTTHGLDQVIPVLVNGNDLQTAAAVIYKLPKSLAYFIEKFGKEKCAGLERQSMPLSRNLGMDRYARPDSIPEYTWNAMNPSMRRRMALRNGPVRESGGSLTPFPVLELQEITVDDWSVNEFGHDVLVKHPDLDVDEHNYHYIVPPGCRLFPRKRLVVFAGDRVMYDGPAPHWHGLYPFTMLQLNPCVWQPGGISKYHDLIPLNQSLNRIGVGVEESVIRALAGTWVAVRGKIAQDVWDQFQPGKPGQKLMLNPLANPASDIMEKMAPPLPPQVEMWSRYLLEALRRRAGVLDVMGISRKNQVPGGDTIAEMQDAMSGPYRLEGRYVESGLKRAAKQLVSNIIQFTTSDKRLRVLGADGLTWSDFVYEVRRMANVASPREDHFRMFSINIAQGSTHGQSEFSRKVTAFNLYRSGGLSLRGLYRQLNFPESAEENMREMAEEQEAGVGPGSGRVLRQKRSERTGSAT